MGTFGGHALPGSFFIIFSLWHIVQIYRRYYKCRNENSRFTSNTWFNMDCLCGRLKDWPIEPALKVFFTSVGLALEIYTGTRNGVFDAPGNLQHATMFFFFGLTGIIEVLLYMKASLPPNLNYATFILANSVEFILFRFHLHGREDLDVLVHTLLLYVLGLIIMFSLIEMKYMDNLLVALANRLLIFVEGTWFYHIGFILYNPISGAEKWDLKNHRQMMIVTAYFTWHLGVALLIVLLIGVLVSCFYRRNNMYSNEDSLSMKRLIGTNSNGQTVVNLNDDSDEDIEFQKPY